VLAPVKPLRLGRGEADEREAARGGITRVPLQTGPAQETGPAPRSEEPRAGETACLVLQLPRPGRATEQVPEFGDGDPELFRVVGAGLTCLAKPQLGLGDVGQLPPYLCQAVGGQHGRHRSRSHGGGRLRAGTQRVERGCLVLRVALAVLLPRRTGADDAAGHQLVAAAPDLVHGIVVGGRDQHGLTCRDRRGHEIGDQLALAGAGRARGHGETAGHGRPENRRLCLVAGQRRHEAHQFGVRVGERPGTVRGVGREGTEGGLPDLVRPLGDAGDVF
jgi:hypothetical protein